MTAIILTDGKLNQLYGKTAHGLITGLSRYPIQAVIDEKHAGLDAGWVIDGNSRNIPIYLSIEQAFTKLSSKPTHCIVGIATPGGFLTPSLVVTLKIAIRHRMTIVNGLHESVAEHPELKTLIREFGVEIIDIRKAKGFRDLHPWQGRVQHITTPRVAILGMDCAIGKRTTSQLLYGACLQEGIKTEMIYTGQTGWLQGFQYGFIFDSTLNDFVAGELEEAVVSCVKQAQPQLILFEGQSALRNPSGPCGAEFICSGGAKGVILQHIPERKYFYHGAEIFYPLPTLANEISLIEQYGAKVLAVTLNTSALTQQSWQRCKQEITDDIGLPVVCPREEGVTQLLPILRNYIQQTTIGFDYENSSN